MENINSKESLKIFKEELYSNNPKLKPEFIESITNVQAVLKMYFQPTYLIGNQNIIYTDNFVDYIIEVGLKKASKLDLQHLFKSIISVYNKQFQDFLTDSNIANIYEYSEHKLEFDFNFNNGIVLRHNGKVIKKEFNDISKIEDRIKEIRQAQNLVEDMKISNDLMKQLPRLKNIIK